MGVQNKYLLIHDGTTKTESNFVIAAVEGSTSSTRMFGRIFATTTTGISATTTSSIRPHHHHRQIHIQPIWYDHHQ